ncbi:methylated-DNA--[protein]-cysteine S-methyltransferase [bacterium]|nr:MAG: methylated-DNA--[protein]-cysteine S-methyltransferase [bacterium]
MRTTTIASPIGPLVLVAEAGAITGLYMNTPHHAVVKDDWIESPDDPLLRRAAERLGEYFARARREFDLPLLPKGTEFQARVWAELLRIPYGATISYGELARRMGDANASRAVGLANGRNPISILVPCHRVIGASGKMTGYGGGVERKIALLELERPELGLFGAEESGGDPVLAS